MSYEIKLLHPAITFIESLEVKLRAKAFRTINLLKEFGPFLTEPHSKKIKGTQELYELRIKQGNNICRLFYFHHAARIYIITSGYIKKEQKTNAREIEYALKLIQEIKEISNENENI